MIRCSNLWSGLDISNTGEIKPCCKIKTELVKGWKNHNIIDGIDAYKKSDGIRWLKEQFALGLKPSACVRCWEDESAGVTSKRELDNSLFDASNTSHTGKTKLLALPLGNLCNLKCRFCHPKASSALKAEWSELFNVSGNVQKWHQDRDVMNTIINESKDCIDIHLHGGEPFLYDHEIHKEILNSINTPDKVKIHYSTNGTIMPPDDMWSIWDRFGKVEIQISIEDIEHRYEYNRFPAKWQKTMENIFRYKEQTDKYPRIRLGFATVVNAFTVYYLPEFMEWFKNNKLPQPWLSRIHEPDEYRCSIFPDMFKEQISEKLLKSKNVALFPVVKWVQEQPSISILEFIRKTELHDRYRKQNFSDTFPELYNAIKEFYQ